MEPLRISMPDDVSELEMQNTKAPMEFVDEKLG